MSRRADGDRDNQKPSTRDARKENGELRRAARAWSVWPSCTSSDHAPHWTLPPLALGTDRQGPGATLGLAAGPLRPLAPPARRCSSCSPRTASSIGGPAYRLRPAVPCAAQPAATAGSERPASAPWPNQPGPHRRVPLLLVRRLVRDARRHGRGGDLPVSHRAPTVNSRPQFGETDGAYRTQADGRVDRPCCSSTHNDVVNPCPPRGHGDAGDGTTVALTPLCRRVHDHPRWEVQRWRKRFPCSWPSQPYRSWRPTPPPRSTSAAASV